MRARQAAVRDHGTVGPSGVAHVRWRLRLLQTFMLGPNLSTIPWTHSRASRASRSAFSASLSQAAIRSGARPSPEIFSSRKYPSTVSKWLLAASSRSFARCLFLPCGVCAGPAGSWGGGVADWRWTRDGQTGAGQGNVSQTALFLGCRQPDRRMADASSHPSRSWPAIGSLGTCRLCSHPSWS